MVSSGTHGNMYQSFEWWSLTHPKLHRRKLRMDGQSTYSIDNFILVHLILNINNIDNKFKII